MKFLIKKYIKKLILNDVLIYNHDSNMLGFVLDYFKSTNFLLKTAVFFTLICSLLNLPFPFKSSVLKYINNIIILSQRNVKNL